ncbi:hypothetical protein [Pseudomarimonas arenosa]|uniref:Phosphodiesterase n=1 Tax=Pseudomarimonas arenosa TaxID=2774145 RepID=A0AAW3ZPR9_9GAMM|nr:hypothetical protein [Pseudomarimonas arenosa]MBD8526296.1 hypothetical protein [Pseudomarimonas arenosa]
MLRQACVLSIAFFVVGTIGWAAPAQADVLLIERVEARKDIELPKRGELKDQVERKFGKPTQIHAPVGGGSPQHPPITRWDYAEFSVYFEHNHVVSAVLKRTSKYETGPKAVSGQ